MPTFRAATRAKVSYVKEPKRDTPADTEALEATVKGIIASVRLSGMRQSATEGMEGHRWAAAFRLSREQLAG